MLCKETSLLEPDEMLANSISCAMNIWLELVALDHDPKQQLDKELYF